MSLEKSPNPSPTKRKLWLDCACGFSGFIAATRPGYQHCPHCEPSAYEQLSLAAPRPQFEGPAGWENLSPEQKERVERYIATLLAEQLRLL